MSDIDHWVTLGERGQVLEAGTFLENELGEEIVGKVRERLARDELDALIAMSPENLAYCAGSVPPSLRIVRQRLAFAVVPRQGPASAVVVSVDASVVGERTWLSRIQSYSEFEEGPVNALVTCLQEAGLEKGRIGIESTYLSSYHHQELSEKLPHATLVPADSVFTDLRLYKTPGEIALIRDIGIAAERIAAEACSLVSAGATERQLGQIITELYADAGGDELSMLVVGSGPRSAHPNAPPTDRVISEGELVRLDIIGTKKGYYSDVARTATVGPPTAEQAGIYELLKSVHDQAIDAVKPGVAARDVYQIYSDAMREAGLPPYHFVGHGLGVTLHEGPFIDARSEEPLQEGMVLCIEPLTFVEDRFGIQIEDEILVTSDGCERLTTATDQLLEIGL